MNTPIIPWRFVNDKIGQIEEAKDLNSLLMYIGTKEEGLKVLRHVPLIIHFYWLLVEACNNRVSKEDTLKLTMKDFVESLGKESKLYSLWEDFKECWREVKEIIQEQGCTAQNRAENEVVDINDGTLLCAVIGTSDDDYNGGGIIKALRDGMGKLQDEILVKINVRCGKCTKLIQYCSFCFCF